MTTSNILRLESLHITHYMILSANHQSQLTRTGTDLLQLCTFSSQLFLS